MLEGLTPPPNRLYGCKVAQVLNDLEPSDQEILKEALANTHLWGHNPLARALKARGIDLSDTTIARHRSGECFCAK